MFYIIYYLFVVALGFLHYNDIMQSLKCYGNHSTLAFQLLQPCTEPLIYKYNMGKLFS